MIQITNPDLFGKVIAAALVSVGDNSELVPQTRTRCVNAIAKAAARIETSGCFMEYDPAENTLLIWSDSNEIYTVGPSGRCGCRAAEFDHVCWHRAAKRLIERYSEAMERITDNHIQLNEAAPAAALEGGLQ